MNYSQLLQLIMPQVVVVVSAFLILGIDMGVAGRWSLPGRLSVLGVLAALACLTAIWWLGSRSPVVFDSLHGGMLVVGGLAVPVQQVLLALSLVTVLLSSSGRFTDHVGEYYALVLLATAGMMFLVSTENLLMIFVSLEVLSLSLYILTAFNKQSRQSAEAALKYFLFGGISAAFLLFGFSLLYGLSGELNVRQIASRLEGGTLDPLLVVALVMVAFGFGFKIAAVPFHLWAPDAYQGAPAPVAAFIASGSKVASFFILARVAGLGLQGVAGNGTWRDMTAGWVPLLAIMGAASMLLGNLAAIAQKSVRRLLAYSAVAQAGYMLLGILAEGQVSPGHTGMVALLYYVITYGLTILGAFGVVMVVQDQNGGETLNSFAGLAKRQPVLGFCMLIFMLSLAGIPPLAGFFGKFYLFAAALGSGQQLGLLWLVVLAITMSAVSLYYYLQVLKQVYVVKPVAGSVALEVSPGHVLLVAVLAVSVLVLGCAPHLLLDRITSVLRVSGL